MTDTLAIALNKLTPWKGNVRKTGAKDGIDELVANWRAFLDRTSARFDRR